MSRSCSLELWCGSDEHSRVDMLLVLMNYGWTTGDTIIYRPLGDIDTFDFIFRPLDAWPEVLDILRQKEVHGESVGVDLFWPGTAIGGTFSVDLYPELPRYVKLHGFWNPDRQLLPGCAWFTDHSWYLSRILPPLLNAGVAIDMVECQDLY